MNGESTSRQSGLDVVLALVGGLIVFVGGRALIGLFGSSPWTLRGAVGAGLVSGFMNLAIVYCQHPVSRRFTPDMAIKVGLLGIALMIITTAVALPAPDALVWRIAVLIVVVTAPTYLFVAGARGGQRGASRGSEPGRGI